MNSTSVKNQLPEPSYLDMGSGRRLAYVLTEGKTPGVMFLGGFKSDMTGSKALALESFCREQERRFLRFDYTGHGRSTGLFHQGTISYWKRDTLNMLDRFIDEPVVLVGSSMGAWLMFLVARERPEKVAGLVGIASAVDFTERLIWDKLSDEEKQKFMEEGGMLILDCYGSEPYPITRQLIEDGRSHLLLDTRMEFPVPVRLVHGTDDKDVPWRMSHLLMECITSPDIELEMVGGGGHRLSEPHQLEVILKAVEEVLHLSS